MPQSWLATGKPKISDSWHCARNLFYLVKGHIARLVQLGMIEAGLTKRIATRGHEENYRTEALFAFRGSHQLNELNGFRHARGGPNYRSVIPFPLGEGVSH